MSFTNTSPLVAPTRAKTVSTSLFVSVLEILCVLLSWLKLTTTRIHRAQKATLRQLPKCLLDH